MSFLELIRAGVTYSLDDGTYCYFMGDDGVGMASQIEQSISGPSQDGDSHRGMKLTPRIFRLFLEIHGTSRSDLYTKRQNLLTLFPPGFQVSVRYNLDHGVRQIDCYYHGDFSMPFSDRVGFAQTVALTLKANTPTFYNPTAKSLTVRGGGGGSFLVPMEVPHTVGASTLAADAQVTYTGTWRTFPRIRIDGPIDNAYIRNDVLGFVLDFTGHSIALSEWYDIDLQYGEKIITDQDGNRIEPSDDSDTDYFHFAPDPFAPGGANPLTITGSATSPTTAINFYWFDRFTGI